MYIKRGIFLLSLIGVSILTLSLNYFSPEEWFIDYPADILSVSPDTAPPLRTDEAETADTLSAGVPVTIHKKKLAENVQLKNESSQKTHQLNRIRYKNRLLLINMFLITCISVLIFVLVRSKYKKEKILESYKTETRIAKKVHDEIANEVYNTIVSVSQEDETTGFDRERLMGSLYKIYATTRNISRESSSIDTGINFPDQLKYMLTEYCCDEVNVIIKNIDSIDWALTAETKKIAVYRCLQELMVNMKKHSFASLVVIEFDISGKKALIQYTDNGKGISGNRPLVKNGLKNVENRMEAIGGSVNFEQSERGGFHMGLIFPITDYV